MFTHTTFGPVTPAEAADRHAFLAARDTGAAMRWSMEYEAKASEAEYDEYLTIVDGLLAA